MNINPHSNSHNWVKQFGQFVDSEDLCDEALLSIGKAYIEDNPLKGMPISTRLMALVNGDALIKGSDLEGGHFSQTLPFFKEVIQRLGIHSPRLDKAIQDLEDNLNWTSELLVEKISRLMVEESFYFDGGWPSHKVIFQVGRHHDGYFFSIINSGQGLKNHDLVSVGDQIKNCQILTVRGIKKEVIGSKEVWQQLKEVESIFCRHEECVYQTFLFVLQGNIEIGSVDIGIASQISGVCAWKCLTALAKLLVEEDDYKELICRIKLGMAGELISQNSDRFSLVQKRLAKEALRSVAAHDIKHQLSEELRLIALGLKAVVDSIPVYTPAARHSSLDLFKVDLPHDPRIVDVQSLAFKKETPSDFSFEKVEENKELEGAVELIKGSFYEKKKALVDFLLNLGSDDSELYSPRMEEIFILSELMDRKNELAKSELEQVRDKIFKAETEIENLDSQDEVVAAAALRLGHLMNLHKAILAGEDGELVKGFGLQISPFIKDMIGNSLYGIQTREMNLIHEVCEYFDSLDNSKGTLFDYFFERNENGRFEFAIDPSKEPFYGEYRFIKDCRESGIIDTEAPMEVAFTELPLSLGLMQKLLADFISKIFPWSRGRGCWGIEKPVSVFRRGGRTIYSITFFNLQDKPRKITKEIGPTCKSFTGKTELINLYLEDPGVVENQGYWHQSIPPHHNSIYFSQKLRLNALVNYYSEHRHLLSERDEYYFFEQVFKREALSPTTDRSACQPEAEKAMALLTSIADFLIDTRKDSLLLNASVYLMILIADFYHIDIPAISNLFKRLPKTRQFKVVLFELYYLLSEHHLEQTCEILELIFNDKIDNDIFHHSHIFIYCLFPLLIRDPRPLNLIVQKKLNLEDCPNETWSLIKGSFVSDHYKVCFLSQEITKKGAAFPHYENFPAYFPELAISNFDSNEKYLVSKDKKIVLENCRHFEYRSWREAAIFQKIESQWYQWVGTKPFNGKPHDFWLHRSTENLIQVMGPDGPVPASIVEIQDNRGGIQIQSDLKRINLPFKIASDWLRKHPFYSKFHIQLIEKGKLKDAKITVRPKRDFYELHSAHFPCFKLTFYKKGDSLCIREYPGFSVVENQKVSDLQMIGSYVLVQNLKGEQFLLSHTGWLIEIGKDADLKPIFCSTNLVVGDLYLIPINSEGVLEPQTQSESLFTAVLYLFDGQTERSQELLKPLISIGSTDKRFQQLCLWICNYFGSRNYFNSDEMAVLSTFQNILINKELFHNDNPFSRALKYREKLALSIQRSIRLLKRITVKQKTPDRKIVLQNTHGYIQLIMQLEKFIHLKIQTNSLLNQIGNRELTVKLTDYYGWEEYYSFALKTLINRWGLEKSPLLAESLLGTLVSLKNRLISPGRASKDSLAFTREILLDVKYNSHKAETVITKRDNLESFVEKTFQIDSVEGIGCPYLPEPVEEDNDVSDWSVELIESLNHAAEDNPLNFQDISLRGIDSQELNRQLLSWKHKLEEYIALKEKELKALYPKIDSAALIRQKITSLAEPRLKDPKFLYRKMALSLSKTIEKEAENFESTSVCLRYFEGRMDLLIHEHTDLNKINRALKYFDSKGQLSPASLKAVYHILSAKRLYDPYEHKEWVVREHLGNILYNSKQVDFFSKKHETALYHIPIGWGKTSVILRDLALELSQNKLPIVIVPSSLFGQNLRDLQYSSKKIYNQESMPFIFHRDIAENSNNLKFLSQHLSRLFRNQGYIITTIESIQSLLLSYVQCLKTSTLISCENRKLVIDMVLFIREHGVAIGDEVHLTLINLKELSYGMSREPIPIGHINACLDVFKLLIKNKISLHDPETAPEIFEESRDHIVETLFPDDFNMQSVIKCDARAALSLSQMDEKQQKKAALYQLLLETIIPFTLSQVYCVDYGPSKDSENLLAKPYSGNNDPCERADFAHPLVYVMLTLQKNWIQGLSPHQLKQILVNQIEQLAEKKLRGVLDIEMKPFISLKKNLGLDTDKIFEATDDDLIALNKQIKSDPKNHFLLLQIVMNSLSPQMKYDAVKLSASPHDLVQWLFPTFIALTGTPENAGSFSHQIALNIQSDYESWGALMNATDNPASQELCVLETMSPEEVVSCIAKEIKTKNARALVDLGYRFQGISNLKAAQMILNALTEIEGVVYYSLDTQKKSENTQSPLLADSDKGGVESGQSMILLRNGNILPFHPGYSLVENYFVYYDQQRSSGWDIPLPEDAALYVTMTKGVDFSLIYQAKGRARKLKLGQTAQLMISEELALEARERFATDDIGAKHIETMAIHWQAKNLQMEMITSVNQQIEMLSRIHILNQNTPNDEEIDSAFYKREPDHFLSQLKVSHVPLSINRFLPSLDQYPVERRGVITKINQQARKILFYDLPSHVSKGLRERSESQSESEAEQESLRKAQIEKLSPLMQNPLDWNFLSSARNESIEELIIDCARFNPLGSSIQLEGLSFTSDFSHTLTLSHTLKGPLKVFGYWLKVQAHGKCMAILISSTEADRLKKYLDTVALPELYERVTFHYRYEKPLAVISNGDKLNNAWDYTHEEERIYGSLAVFDGNISKLLEIDTIEDLFPSYEKLTAILIEVAHRRNQTLQRKSLKKLKSKFSLNTIKDECAVREKREAESELSMIDFHIPSKRSKVKEIIAEEKGLRTMNLRQKQGVDPEWLGW